MGDGRLLQRQKWSWGNVRKHRSSADFPFLLQPLLSASEKGMSLQPSKEATSQNNESTDIKMDTTHNRWRPLIHSMNQAVGLIVMVYLCHQWSNYLQTLHENDMRFSNIKELEREISF